MREKRGLLIYLAGSLMLAVSIFLPYFRYKFVLEGLIEYKESYDLMHLKKLEEWFSGLGTVSAFTRVMIYLTLAAGILGIIMVMFLLLSHDDYLSAVTFGLTAAPPVLGIVANIAIRKDRLISSASTFIHAYKDDLLQQGFTGSSGYGFGFWLLLVGTILAILGLVLYLIDTQFS